MRDRRLAERIIGVIGSGMAGLQALAGLILLIASRFSAVGAGIVKTGGMANVHRAANSVTDFGVQALMAGVISSVIAAAALFILGNGKSGALPGIMLIIAGAENSVVLFAAGLPVGLVLMTAGIVALLRKTRTPEK